MKFLRAFPLVAALAAILSSCSRTCVAGKAQQSPGEQSSNLKPAPDFSLKDANGATVKLSDYRGKVLLLNFWATWCGPCKIEIPWFMEFEQQYKNKGFEVLGVAMDDDGWTAVKPYVADRKFNYRVVLGNDSVANAYGGVDALPTTFVINQEGRILTSHIGLVNRDDYVKEITSLLNTCADSRSSRSRTVPALFDIRAGW
ncbi:MAG: redoxin domain-containing protein [Bryobacteraceae bacterium]